MTAGPRTAADDPGTLEVSVVVPARNAAAAIGDCLSSIRANRPREILVVDGMSTDDTAEISARYADAVLSDEGRGVSYARQMGAQAARCPYVAFIDTDIQLPELALKRLLEELVSAGKDALQASLVAVDSGDYWSQALASHYNRGRSRHWFGLSATLFKKDVFLRFGMDPSFRTGEDIEIRSRLQREGANFGLSREVVVPHAFDAGFRFARDQWLADGAGLGRTIRKFGWRMAAVFFIPAAGAGLGLLRCVGRDFRFMPYYLLYAVFNYVGMVRGLFDRQVRREGN